MRNFSTKHLVYKKGKHYPVLDEFDNQVMIIDEEGDRHWFDEVSCDPSYKVVTEEFLNQETLKQETSDEEKPLKQEKPLRPLENWIQTLSDYKFERCIKECNTIDYGMFWNGDTQCLYLYYNPMKGYTVSDKGFGIPTRVNLQGKPEIKKKVFDNISFQKVVQNALDNEILSLDADEDSLCKFEVPEDRSLFDELKEGLEECVEIKKEREGEWTDKHYDFNYQLTEEDVENGHIRIDAYFVNRMWKINSWDDTGAAFHNLKTFTRMGNEKNSLGRELEALYKQTKRLCKLHGVEVE